MDKPVDTTPEQDVMQIAPNEWEAAGSAVIYLTRGMWQSPNFAELGSGEEPFTVVPTSR